MIFHNCIHCDNLELIPLADGNLPVFQEFICEKCGTTQWIMKKIEQDYPLVAEYVENEVHLSVKKTIDTVYVYRNKEVYSFTIPLPEEIRKHTQI